MQSDIQSIQRIAQDLNNVRGQLQTTRSQVGEITTTLELLDEQPDDNAVCLLYTSPSPRDRQKSRMPSSA